MASSTKKKGKSNRVTSSMKTDLKAVKRATVADGNDGSEMDPTLWVELPEELLEMVLSKLPFSRAVAFRAVCKRWHSDVIPSAHRGASGPAAVLYFSRDYEAKYKNHPLWMQILSLKTEGRNDSYEFDFILPESVPTLRDGEDLILLSCEGGLLFFGYRDKGMVRDILVFNPLTSVYRTLALPRPVQQDRRYPSNRYKNFLPGVIFDSKTESYFFVCAGKEGTYVYNSITCVWTSGPSFLEFGGGGRYLSTFSNRNVCCNGSLYWYVEYLGVGEAYVMKFDVHNATWTIIPDVFDDCEDAAAYCSARSIAFYKGDLLLWHLHGKPLRFENNTPAHLFSCEHFDEDDVDETRSQYIDWPCRCDVNRDMNHDVKMIPMPGYMMEKIYMFFFEHFHMKNDRFFNHSRSVENPTCNFLDYYSFSQGNFIYHVVHTNHGFKTLVQDTKDDTYTALPWMKSKRFPGIQRRLRENVWIFTSSLTAVP